MKYFKVTILTKGKKSFEIIEAANKIAAIKIAKKKNTGKIVQKAVETTAPSNAGLDGIIKNIKKSFEPKIDINNKIAAIRQLAVMTDAGISIHDAITEVAVNVENPKLKKIYNNIGADINAGKSIADSIEPYTEEFGHVTIAMTNLGEKTGNIAGSYAKLATILEDIRDNIKKFKKAIKGPIITLIAMAIAFTIMITVVVPKFKAMFEKFETELPVPTQILLFLENILTNYGLYVLGGLGFILFMFLRQYKNDKKFKYKVDKVLVHPKFYLIHKIIFFSTMHKYTLVFGELVKSGITCFRSVRHGCRYG